jgi:Na+-translocating ferredoxin:NAD+ oxidoreductase RnfG subunit
MGPGLIEGPTLRRKIKFSGQEIEKMGGKYTKIKKNGMKSGAFEGSLECSRRSF